MELSLRWAARCHRVHAQDVAALFGIIQRMHSNLRQASLEGLQAQEFSGIRHWWAFVGRQGMARIVEITPHAGSKPAI